jgi:hypothetical protein
MRSCDFPTPTFGIPSLRFVVVLTTNFASEPVLVPLLHYPQIVKRSLYEVLDEELFGVPYNDIMM